MVEQLAGGEIIHRRAQPSRKMGAEKAFAISMPRFEILNLRVFASSPRVHVESFNGLFQRTGRGALTGLRLPCLSTARTPKK